MEFKWESGEHTIRVSSMPGVGDAFVLLSLSGAYGIPYETDIIQNYGRDGGVRIGTRVGTRGVSVQGEVLAPYAVNREKLMRAFMPHTDGLATFVGASGKIRKQRFWATTQPIFINTDNTRFMVTIEAEDPYFFSEEESVVDSLIPMTSNCSFPLEITAPDASGDKIWTFSEFLPEAAVELINTSDGDVGGIFTIRATGTCANPNIVNVATSEYMKLSLAMSSGMKATLDTRPGRKSVTVTNADGTSFNGMPLLDTGSTFHQIKRGGNVFRLEADDGLAAMNCFVKFTPAYLDL